MVRQFFITGFIKYPLSNSTLVNNYRVMHLINCKSLLVKGSFQYTKAGDYI